VATYQSLQSSPQASESAITVNAFMFCSLALTLTCAFVGILRKEELKQHLSWLSNLKRKDARARLEDRQFSFDLNTNRRLWDCANQLSVGLTVSIGLFTVGILVLLWSIRRRLALAMFLFLCFTLALLFWRDVSFYYVRCRARARTIRCKVYDALPGSWDRLRNLLKMDRAQVDKGVLPPQDDDGRIRLLSHAIISRASGLTESGVIDSKFWLQRVNGLLGLARLSTSESEPEEGRTVLLRRIVDLVVMVVEDHDVLKANIGAPLTLWAQITGSTEEKPTLQQRSFRSDRHLADNPSAMTRKWEEWLWSAFAAEYNTEELCLLSDVVSQQLERTARTTKAPTVLTRNVTAVQESLEELLSAFCLAWRMFIMVPYGPTDVKLRQALALAGARLQPEVDSLSSEIGLASSAGTDGDNRGVAAARWLASANPQLLIYVNPKLRGLCYDLDSIFQDEFKDQWQIKDGENVFGALHCRRSADRDFRTDELAANTFLDAALRFDVTLLLSRKPDDGAHSDKSGLFTLFSVYALAGLRRLHLKSAGTILGSLRPKIKNLGLRLTEVLRHDVLSNLPGPNARYTLDDLNTISIPWHGALQYVVANFPAEMGALLRYLVSEADDGTTSGEYQELYTAAPLFSPDEKADKALLDIIKQHRAQQNNPVHVSGAEDTTPARDQDVSSSPEVHVHESSNPGSDQASVQPIESFVPLQSGSLGHSTGLQTGNSLRALNNDRDLSSHTVIDVLPAAPGGREPLSLEAAAARPGHSQARTDSTVADEPSLHVVIDIQPVHAELRSSSEGVLSHTRPHSDLERRRRVSSEHIAVQISASDGATDPATARTPRSSGDRAHDNQGEHTGTA
jgi:hypothetical protein